MTHSAKYSFNKNILCHFHLRYAGPIGVEIEHYCIAVTAELWSVTKSHTSAGTSPAPPTLWQLTTLGRMRYRAYSHLGCKLTSVGGHSDAGIAAVNLEARFLSTEHGGGGGEAIREGEDAVTTVHSTLPFLLLQDPHKEPDPQPLHMSNSKSGMCGQQTQHKDRLLNISSLITEGSLLVVIKIHKLATRVSVNTEISASFIAAEFNHMYTLCFGLWHEPKD